MSDCRKSWFRISIACFQKGNLKEALGKTFPCLKNYSRRCFSASAQSLSHPLLLLGTAFSQPPHPTSDGTRPHPYFDVIRRTPSFACSFVPIPGAFVEVKFQLVSVFKGTKSKLKVPEGEEDRRTNFSFSSPQGVCGKVANVGQHQGLLLPGNQEEAFQN